VQADVSPQYHVPPETKGKSKTIAVVAAQWHLRTLIRAAIENKRTRVIDAMSVEELAELAQDEQCDLVILDADIAPHDGSDALTQCKQDPALATVPVLLLTNRAPAADLQPSATIQPDRTLHKHFSPFELLNIVYALIGY
jgi:DNA-binding response OmpR family regulator